MVLLDVVFGFKHSFYHLATLIKSFTALRAKLIRRFNEQKVVFAQFFLLHKLSIAHILTKVKSVMKKSCQVFGKKWLNHNSYPQKKDKLQHTRSITKIQVLIQTI